MRQLPKDVFHIADAANWPGIQAAGLLCTAEIAARLGRDTDAYARLVGYRPQGVEVPGVAYVRDQAPMPPHSLASCLDKGLTPDDWYRLVNAHVFFWLAPDRVTRHLQAMKARPQLLLTFDGRRLAEAYGKAAYVTPFNVGAALRRPAQRGRRTFVPVADWQSDGWASEAAVGQRPRRAAHPPAELVVRGSAPDALHFLTDLRYESGVARC